MRCITFVQTLLEARYNESNNNFVFDDIFQKAQQTGSVKGEDRRDELAQPLTGSGRLCYSSSSIINLLWGFVIQSLVWSLFIVLAEIAAQTLV